MTSLSKSFLLLNLLSLGFAPVCFGQGKIDNFGVTNSENSVGILSREERHRWERHVRGFRRKHNFAISSGISSGNWDVKRFGTLNDRTYDNSGLFTRFNYSFHIQIYEGFGYLLGSSLGYHYESTDARRPFKPVSAIMLPGLVAGLVYNLTPAIRISGAFDAYLERYDGIEERDGKGDDPKISITMQTYDRGAYHLSGFVDMFYNLYWAIRLEGHMRKTKFIAPRGSDEVSDIDADLSKNDRWLGLGFLYHML
jgi:hypothetical protein